MKNSTNTIILFYCMAIISLLSFTKADAQNWEQLGPGGGGQVRCVYIYEYFDGTTWKYDIYIGSDVAGVWVIKGIKNLTDIDDYLAQGYVYISNHRIMRFTNRFYKPKYANGHYLYVTNNNGVDRIDLNAQDGAMKQLLNLPESWVSDLFISDLHGSKHKVYFITGNTRIEGAGPGNFKSVGRNDFYCAELNFDQSAITVTNSIPLPGMAAQMNVYCMNVDEHNDAVQANDEFLVGSETGLYHFKYPDIAGNTITGQIEGPNFITNYQVTSVQPAYHSSNAFIITVYGAGENSGVYLFDRTTHIWTSLINFAPETNCALS